MELTTTAKADLAEVWSQVGSEASEATAVRLRGSRVLADRYCGFLFRGLLRPFNSVPTRDSTMNNTIRTTVSHAPPVGPWRHGVPLVIAVLLACVFLWIDWLLPLGIADGILFTNIVLVGWWMPGQKQTVIQLAIASSLLVVVGYLLSPSSDVPVWFVLVNRGYALFTIWSTAIILGIAKTAMAVVENQSIELKKLSVAVEHSPASVIITDSHGTIEYVNPRFSELTGYTWADVVGQNPRLLQSGLQDAATYASLWQSITANKTWRGDLLDKKKSGELYWASVSISTVCDVTGKILYFIGVQEDVTHIRNLEAQLREQAESDALTGLPNRKLFQDRLQQAVLLGERHQQTFVLMFVDLDRFKWVNDTLGHDAGDALLIEVSRRLKGVVRKSDTVARLGGDEFTVILSIILHKSMAEFVARKILEQLQTPFHLKGQEVVISGSVGISLFPSDGTTGQELAKNADTAMYQAKKSGRNTFRFFSDAINE